MQNFIKLSAAILKLTW